MITLVIIIMIETKIKDPIGKMRNVKGQKFIFQCFL